MPRDGIACSITEMFGPDRYLKLVGMISAAAIQTICMTTKTTRMLASVRSDAEGRNRLQHHRDVRPRQISETGRHDQRRRDTDNLYDDENDQDAGVRQI